jgi:hypothetical protein
MQETARLPPTAVDFFEAGRSWMEDNLFNGEYFEHKVIFLQVKAGFTKLRGRRI